MLIFTGLKKIGKMSVRNNPSSTSSNDLAQNLMGVKNALEEVSRRLDSPDYEGVSRALNEAIKEIRSLRTESLDNCTSDV